MKSIKELREQYQVITEKEDKEQRKLTALVRAGLFDAKKLPILKRALEKGVDKMTPAEKKILIDLLDSLMNQVISNEPIYMKVKRNVQSMDEEIVAEAVRAPVTISDVPSIVVLKRKAVRVYPGGQQVGLYYSQQLDKYVTIPFGEAGITEETEIDESLGLILRGGAAVGGAALKYGMKYKDKLADIIRKRRAASELSKAEKLARNVKRGKALERLKNIRSKNRNAFKGKNKKRNRRGDGAADDIIDLGAALGSGAGGNNQQNRTFDPQKFKTTSTVEKRPGSQTSIVAPQYRTGGDAPVDPATARRLQRQFYSQPQVQREYVEVNLDGNLVEINSGIAEKLVNVYESLSDYNKKKMVDMLMNEETQNKIVEFVRRY